ncbi:MAG TPA: peptide ABC transporter substrate-binding protein [Anaerolineales bacterium]|nr:peptide ABC transporter substrate-binding protein [Anaerolineales bacterium]
MTKSRFVALGVFCLCAIVLLVANPSVARPNYASYDKDNSLIYSSGEPETIDPALTRSGAGGIIGDLFSGLVVLDPNMKVRPALALSWQVSPDGLTYTFALDPAAKFSDGTPLTSADVVFSWKRAAHPDTASETVLLYLGDVVGVADYHAGTASEIAGLSAPDAHTIQVQIDAPKPYFLAKLTYPVSWVVQQDNVEGADWEENPVGSGPFRQVQHIENDIWILERNPYYNGIRPAVSNVVYQMYKGYSQRLYQNDEVSMTGIAKDQLSLAENPSDLLYGQVFPQVSLCTSYVTFNSQKPPFDDPLVRKAFVHAFDQNRYMEAITHNEDIPAHGILPPGVPGYDASASAPADDPQLARELLAQSKYAGAAMPELVWTISTSGTYTDSSVAILQSMWEETLGVKIQVVGIDWYDYYDEISAGHFGNLLSEGWCADYIDPENFLDLLFHSGTSQNTGGYSSAAYDQLLEQARVETDIQARIDLYQQAERLLVEDAPALFLSHSGPSYALLKPYLFGYTPAPIGVPQNHLMWIQR